MFHDIKNEAAGYAYKSVNRVVYYLLPVCITYHKMILSYKIMNYFHNATIVCACHFLFSGFSPDLFNNTLVLNLQ